MLGPFDTDAGGPGCGGGGVRPTSESMRRTVLSKHERPFYPLLNPRENIGNERAIRN